MSLKLVQNQFLLILVDCQTATSMKMGASVKHFGHNYINHSNTWDSGKVLTLAATFQNNSFIDAQLQYI